MSAKRSKRLNWTGRITIDKSCVEIRREKVADDQPNTLTVNLNLAEYSFPDSAAVVLEASDRLTSMRFDFGTIGSLSTYKTIELNEFPVDNSPKLRLLVANTTSINLGKILGSAERIKITDTKTGESSRNIFKVKTRSDMGEEVWRVDFDLDDFPKLEINKNIPKLLHQLETNQLVQSMILPVAFRIVLTELARNLRVTMNEDGEDSWVSIWLQFCKELCGAEDPHQFVDDEERIKTWTDECVAAFAKLHSFASFMKKSLEN